jgi:PhzF family phenazine biosynthesis protein
MSDETLYRVTAFAEVDGGGNPAGVWIGDALPDEKEMQRIAAEVGYPETAFVAPTEGLERTVRYYSPEIEVPFCGHATIATGSILGTEGDETLYKLSTRVGDVAVTVRSTDGRTEVSLESVDTKHKFPDDELFDEVLAAIDWRREELDGSIPPALAFAGAWHLVIAVSTLDRLQRLEYDFERLKNLMLKEDITTLQLVWRENEQLFHARNPFPAGGIVEDPATGAAAAALGGYLRDARIISVPMSFEIRQGETMGRPSLLKVFVPKSGGVMVTGSARPLD